MKFEFYIGCHESLNLINPTGLGPCLVMPIERNRDVFKREVPFKLFDLIEEYIPVKEKHS